MRRLLLLLVVRLGSQAESAIPAQGAQNSDIIIFMQA
jgi:hypothetical protein